MILVRIARIIHAIICVAAFMVFVNHSSARESDPSEAVQTETKHDNVPSTSADLSPLTGSDCAAPIEGSQAIVFAPLQTSEFARGRHAKRQGRAREGRSAISTDPTPTFQRHTAFCTLKAAERYRRIADNGGWVRIPKPLRQGASADDVKRLRQRLAAEADLPMGDRGRWDEALTNALKMFQRRAGLQESGEVDEATLKALNVPADVRAHELESSAMRIADLKIQFDQPYVVVNIPAASVEAVENRRVVQRHTAIAGKSDSPSPQLTAAIQGITLNPTWTIPHEIVESELIPKLKKDPHYLSRAKLVVLDRNGRKVRHIHWSTAASLLTFRQEPGSKNPLGKVRIDMPNRDAVYMHDTPMQRLFADNYRFLSHGCVRVDGIYDLASWLLISANSQGNWTAEALADAARGRDQKKIKLSKTVPVAWVYLDAWESADGVVHFAPDVYDLDNAGTK
jgi:L,D-transpeptidase YcbB